MTKVPTEYEEQKELVAWFDGQYRQYKARLFCIPNGTHLAGGARQRTQQATRLKLQGQRNGVPDLFLPIPASGYHGLFIEMKRIKGATISQQQERWHEWLNGAGYKAVFCYGAEQAKEVITCYLSDISPTMKAG